MTLKLPNKITYNNFSTEKDLVLEELSKSFKQLNKESFMILFFIEILE